MCVSYFCVVAVVDEKPGLDSVVVHLEKPDDMTTVTSKYPSSNLSIAQVDNDSTSTPATIHGVNFANGQVTLA